MAEVPHRFSPNARSGSHTCGHCGNRKWSLRHHTFTGEEMLARLEELDQPPPVAPLPWTEGEPPKDGEVYDAVLRMPMRFLAYKPSSEQARAGKPGRWQRMNEYGGWENSPAAGHHYAFAGWFKDGGA